MGRKERHIRNLRSFWEMGEFHSAMEIKAGRMVGMAFEWQLHIPIFVVVGVLFKGIMVY